MKFETIFYVEKCALPMWLVDAASGWKRSVWAALAELASTHNSQRARQMRFAVKVLIGETAGK